MTALLEKGTLAMEKTFCNFLNLSIFFILLLLPFLCPATSQAKDETMAAATVIALRGSVQAIAATGETRTLAVKSPIKAGDTIKTGKTGRVQILFTDNTIYSLGRNSEMKISEYQWEANKNQGTLKTKVKEGIFRVMGGSITRVSPENFITETPAATIGIRGSMYAGTVTPSKLLVVFQGGKGIVVTNAYGTVVITRPGYGTKVTQFRAPETPRQLSEQDMVEFRDDLTADQQSKAILYFHSPDEQTTNRRDQQITWPDAVNEIVFQSDLDQIDMTSGSLVGIEVPQPTERKAFFEGLVLAQPSNGDMPPPAAPIPTDGISSYLVTISGTSTDVDNISAIIDEVFRVEVNWHNDKVLGRIINNNGNPPLFFIGDLNGDQIVNVKILGSNLETSETTTHSNSMIVTATSGSATGSLSGTNYDLFSLSGSGYSYEVEPYNQPWFDKWEIAGTGARETQNQADLYSPQGTEVWTGFVTGISENMASPDSFRRLFMNSDADSFTFTIDKDHGTLSGSLSAFDVNGLKARIVNLDLGGSLASAFVLEDNFAAELGCSSGDCIQSSMLMYGGLKSYGNYMISAAPEKNSISDYVTWGYWEIAYEDPATGSQYHTHIPGSRWIAGAPTPEAEVNSLATANFTGHYSGVAYANRIDTTTTDKVTDLTGTVEIDVDFGNINAASAVQGSIDLGEVTLQVNSGPAGNASLNGFSNTVNGVTGPSGVQTNSQFNGAFYGPEANAIAGNFYAPFDSGVKYIGIYGAKR